jgi:hypothetical protein
MVFMGNDAGLAALLVGAIGLVIIFAFIKALVESPPVIVLGFGLIILLAVVVLLYLRSNRRDGNDNRKK